MTALAVDRLGMLDRIAEKPTEELEDLYRTVRLIVDEADVLDPWVDVAVSAAHELRLRIAADWLHQRWCGCPSAGRHEDAAFRIVNVFESGKPGDLADAVYRALWPDTPFSQRGARDVSACAAFLDLEARLVSVVPAEVTA